MLFLIESEVIIIIKEGYLYHIKEDFFIVANDNTLLKNHFDNTRPMYLALKNNEILWLVPLSSKISKYQKIINQKIKKYGKCKSILIRKIGGKYQAVLLQNAFPIIEKYIDHIHMQKNIPTAAVSSVKKEIKSNLKELLILKSKGFDLFFTNIDYIEKIMKQELICKK